MGNETLLNHLSTGDASSDNLDYHEKCNKYLWSQCIKIDKDGSCHNIEMNGRRVQVYESIVSFVLGQEAIEPGSICGVKGLNELYVKNLTSFGIEEEGQTTKFTQRLLTSIPNLVSSTVNKNTAVFFGDKVDELIVDFAKSPDEFFAALQKVMHPNGWEIVQQDNKFTGSFDSLRQVQSVLRTFWRWKVH